MDNPESASEEPRRISRLKKLRLKTQSEVDASLKRQEACATETADDLPSNIWIFQCDDDGSHGPAIANYFHLGGGTIYIMMHKNQWYFFHADPDIVEKWHKPGPMGIEFCDRALINKLLTRVTEKQFEERTGVWFLKSAKAVLGMQNPWKAILER